ncbi:hypothetical protein GLAREA_07320 [Glarea lozoyensis ATCC 20868]|uniref:Uncharacterized protein n=1 Tax=Glarea lozoyensis (strain ATCC 20868 / MF5171) TaxID=1116229 RepID=S3D0Y2_GLAL2|nr:uncharacterized protein GLAREA_07320 [Glarea lozoyensis ATCC 20868]EPE32187.1 hypothetical protein GLAREA_07320 [Glarea lozoyensis ATCC 20868]
MSGGFSTDGSKWGVYKDSFAPPPPSRIVKAWERAPRTATAPRLHGQKVWKRPGLRSHDNKENHEAAQAELLKGGLGSRKRARIQGAKENISDPKWLDNAVAGDISGDAPGIVEDEARLSKSCEEVDALQRIPRKRTNADHILTPRKPLQKRSSSEANLVLSPLKVLLSPEKQKNRRKSVRKSFRRTSLISQDIQAASPRRESSRQSELFDISMFSDVAELPETIATNIISPVVKAKVNVPEMEHVDFRVELPTEGTINTPPRLRIELDSQEKSVIELEADLLAREEMEATHSVFLAEDSNQATEESVDNSEATSMISVSAPQSLREKATVATVSEEKTENAENESISAPQRHFLTTDESLPSPTAVNTPVKVAAKRRPATEKPATRHTTRVTRRSLRQPDLFSIEPLRVTRSRSPRKRAVLVDITPVKMKTYHEGESDSDDEAIHQQLFDCPSPRKASRDIPSADNSIPNLDLSTKENADESRQQSELAEPTEPNSQEETSETPTSSNSAMVMASEVQTTTDSVQAETTSEVPSEIDQIPEIDQGYAQTNVTPPSEAVASSIHAGSPSPVRPALVHFEPTEDDSILSNDPFTEECQEDSTLPIDGCEDLESTLESFELMEPITISLSTNTAVEHGSEHDDDASEDMTENITVEVAVDTTQELKLGSYDEDDTDVLFNFLTRVKADKAAKADKEPIKRKRSLPHSPIRLSLGDEGVDELASPEIVQKDPFDVSLPSESPKKRRKTSKAPRNDEDGTEPQSFRRSGRTRLPVTKSMLPAPNFISIGRPNGDTTVNLKKDHDRELASLTRNNTRKNKGAALHPQALLLKQAGGKESPASRHKALKEVFDEKAHKKQGKKKKTVVWAEELTQFQSVEKKEIVAAAQGKSVEVAKVEIKLEPVKEPEMVKEAAAPVEEKKEAKKSSIPRVSMKSKIALGMAVNGTPARKMRKRL